MSTPAGTHHRPPTITASQTPCAVPICPNLPPLSCPESDSAAQGERLWAQEDGLGPGSETPVELWLWNMLLSLGLTPCSTSPSSLQRQPGRVPSLSSASPEELAGCLSPAFPASHSLSILNQRAVCTDSGYCQMASVSPCVWDPSF